MKHNFEIARTFLKAHGKEIAITGAVALGVAGLIVLIIVLFIRSGPAEIVYQPIAACEALTLEEATDLMGDKTVKSGAKDPVLSGHLVTSQCGYADGTADVNDIKVAAVTIRSGIDDEGVAQNKSEFAAGTPTSGIETVKDIGDAAYFNFLTGQLNVLNGNHWILLSYGVGTSPEENTVENALELARKIVE